MNQTRLRITAQSFFDNQANIIEKFYIDEEKEFTEKVAKHWYLPTYFFYNVVKTKAWRRAGYHHEGTFYKWEFDDLKAARKAMKNIAKGVTGILTKRIIK